MKRHWTLALIAAFALVAIGGWYAGTRTEPVYQGKPISYWIEPWRHEGETEASVKAAFEEMDGRAVEWLIRELKWRPSNLALWFNRFTARWDFKLSDNPDRRHRAAIALSELGARAQSAIHVLERVAADPVEPNEFSSDNAARAALVRIREEPVENLFREIDEGAGSYNGATATFALALLPEHADVTVPFLVGRLDPTNSWQSRTMAALALEEMAVRPEVCVPVLSECLNAPEQLVQLFALSALAAFGTNAVEAFEAVSRMTNSVDAKVQGAAIDTIDRIQHGPQETPFWRLKGLESK